MTEADEKVNNGEVLDDQNNQENPRMIEIEGMGNREGVTLYSVLHRLLADIFFPDPDSSASTSLIQRIKKSLHDNCPLLREASRNSTRDLLRWTRQGGAFRALLVISVGTITLMALTGLLVFMLFFLAATTNAVIISLFISLAAAGGFFALFFACVTTIYIGALLVAAFVISTATISTIVAVVIATGWIGFFYTIWLATRKSMSIAKHSLKMTGSALSAYSTAHRGRHHYGSNKVSG